MEGKISRIGLLVLGCLFIVIGISRGEVGKLFTKAINICLECIGIG
ncbi:CD1871A family CXXC motif-containing protein [Wukongibacter baidiensis]